ncbi:MAG: hypothetical protein JO288_13575 [Hyphomicrobiales bacterium]|nr:hypothetical protein [Hyphomicrobiales bacterium]
MARFTAFDREVDLGLAAVSYTGEDLAVDRRDPREGPAVERLDIGAVEGAPFDLERRASQS